MNPDKNITHQDVKKFYNEVYYSKIYDSQIIPGHLIRLARKVGINKENRILDIACGTGQWLRAASIQGAIPAGIDISDKAIRVCKKYIPEGVFYQGNAESLAFDDSTFNLVSCLGALEHFISPKEALREMVRVGTPNAQYLILVPNSDFLTAKLGIYKGTGQTDLKEELRNIDEWRKLFNECGLVVANIWKDLHVLSWDWIRKGSPVTIPFRALQALSLPFWPLKWQYQLYFLCNKEM